MYKISSEFDYKQKNTEEMIQGKSQLFSVDFFSQTKKTPGIAASSFNPASGPRSEIR